MNLILFKKEEISIPVLSDDIRYQHIKKILKLQQADTFDSGIINGPGGKGFLREFTPEYMIVDFTEEWQSEHLFPVTLIIGIPRPPTARRLLKDITSMGIDRIWFTGTELGEKSYLSSKLWKNNKYMEYVLEGAQQGESTLLPEIRRFYSLKECLKQLDGGQYCALDNNESDFSVSQFRSTGERTVIAVGSERGWTDNERVLLKKNHFSLLSMGTRVLRTETACAMATGFILAAAGKI
ncbi:MAG: RNA methyltransferase [Spirochaetaceae bacterium]|nr:RNA methyltransferase [Spirochaetaceae bacterium]